MSKIQWNTDKLLAFTAMFISGVTLVIFIYQTNLMRRQNYISILPYLALATSDQSGNASFFIHVKNYGVGPAIIESVSLTYKDRTYLLSDYDNELLPFLQELVPNLDTLGNFSSATLNKGLAIPANESYTVLAVHNAMEDYQLLAGSLLRLEAEGLYYEIVYKSIQEERWMIHTDSEGPVRLD